MIGLKLPRLFYGRKKRQTVIGQRADFCEFCACVCRHRIVSFQTAPTIMFVSFQFEEVKRESKCEICFTQFAIADSTRFIRNRRISPTIGELIEETNPRIVEKATTEIGEMVERSGLETIQKNRVTNFFRRHEADYHERTRHFFPTLAVGSIQAAIVGLLLSIIVPNWLAIAFTASIFLLAALCFFILLRHQVLQRMTGAICRLVGLVGWSAEEAATAIREHHNRFPNTSSILGKQLSQLSPNQLHSFESGTDFINLLEESR